MEVKWVQKIALTLTLAEKNTCLEYLKMENFAFLWKWVYVGLCLLKTVLYFSEEITQPNQHPWLTDVQVPAHERSSTWSTAISPLCHTEAGG